MNILRKITTAFKQKNNDIETAREDVVSQKNRVPFSSNEVVLSSTNEIVQSKRNIISDELFSEISAALDLAITRAQEFPGLTPHEKALVVYLDGINPQDKASYWSEKEGVNIVELSAKCKTCGYLVQKQSNLEDKSVVELKDMLRSKNAKLSGLKSELVCRVKEIYTPDELRTLNPNKSEVELTEKGRSLVSAVPFSITYDYELEKECLALIARGDYIAAQKNVFDYKSKLPKLDKQRLDWGRFEDYPLDLDLILRMQRMKAFDNDVANTINNAMHILMYIVRGIVSAPFSYYSSWIPNFENSGVSSDDINAAYKQATDGHISLSSLCTVPEIRPCELISHRSFHVDIN